MQKNESQEVKAQTAAIKPIPPMTFEEERIMDYLEECRAQKAEERYND